MDIREIPLSDLVTTGEAAQMTGRDQSVFRHAIRRGDLESALLGGVHMLRRADIEAYIERGGWPKREPEPVP